MLSKQTAFDRLARGEAKASKHINVLTHFNGSTLIDKSGKLIQVVKLSGLDFVTQPEAMLEVYKNRRNSLLKNVTSEFALYYWTIRRKQAEFPLGTFTNRYADELNEKYKNKITTTEMFHNDLYVAVMSKPPEGIIHKGINVVKQLNHHVDRQAKQAYLHKTHQALEALTNQLLKALSDYQPELLTMYEKEGSYYSGPLEFLDLLINFDQQCVPFFIKDASVYLPRKRLFFNRRSGTLEMRSSDGRKKFAAMLSIKEYAPQTFQGMLDALSALRMEYVIAQSYRFYDRHLAKTKLRDQQNDMAQSTDESISQTEEISEAFDEAASGEVGYGIHHFTLICYADTQEALNQHVGAIVACFSDLDMVCVREDIASECAFWAQLPGNFNYVPRPADISTKNMAAFASLHNYATGKIKGNHWGDAVTVLETLSGSPYYFNFHYKDVGNFLVFGAMGSGKTVLVGFLMAQSMKFGGKRILFDKDRGLEILVRALGGVYEVIKPGIATGFNPCQLDDTPENRKFLTNLLRNMLTVTGGPLNESDFEIIENALDVLYRLEKKRPPAVSYCVVFWH